jgi:hypothetical protein
MSYANYLYASDMTNLKQYSPDVKQYLDKKLLPALTSKVRDFYMADKVHFVGYAPDDVRGWQQSLAYLTAALGNEMQGDVQLLIARQDDINANPDLYAIVLKAYWQDKNVFGKDAFSKNGVAVIVGTTDGKTVAWARAFTGMPLGNEQLLVAVRSSLKGVALTPESLFGDVRGQIQTEKSAHGDKQTVLSTRTGGALTPLLWGQPDPATKFARVSMTANDSTDHGSGFLYLASEIQPTTGQSAVIVLIAFLLGLRAWGGCAMFDGDSMFRELATRLNPKTQRRRA